MMPNDTKPNTKVQPKTLTEALIAFHNTGASAKKSGKNPHFKSNYATLEEVIDTVRLATEYGITFTQLIDFQENIIFVRTKIMHVSGEELVSRTPVMTPDMSNPQKMGSGITYAKRYGLQSAFGLPSEDDDGNLAASKTGEVRNPIQSQGAF